MMQRILFFLAVLIWCFLMGFLLGAEGDPVDTLQFGNLQRGMSESEVLMRVNIPDYRLDCGLKEYTYERGVQTERERPRHYHHHDNPSFRVRCEVWVYRGGNTGILTTYLTFENGVLTEKIKRRE